MNWNLENTTKIGVKVSIALNGVAQKHCVEADTSEGYVVRYKMTDDNHFEMDGENFTLEKVGGTVLVTVTDLLDRNAQ